MNTIIKISIITPTFNRGHTLERLYISLKNQTLQNFEWIIIDDGSSDNTEIIVQKILAENKFSIRYYKQENQHKFLTFFKGINLSIGEYIMIADSDDTFPPNTLSILFNEAEKLPKGKYSGVAGLSEDINGNFIGDKFPSSPLDATYFEMRYKYKVKGEQSSLGFREAYLNLNLNLKKFKNKGFIPETIILYNLDSLGYKMRFINQSVRTYITDSTDQVSLANSFYSDKNAFGLRENYKVFLNTYEKKIFTYPVPVIRNLIGYLYYSFIVKKKVKDIFKDIKPFSRFLAVILFPLGYTYYLIKK